MTTIVTRAGKGSPLTHTEVDTNFTNLNTAKFETAAIPLGTAAAPSISFLSDANTGIYSPGADTVAFVTAGNNRVHITSAGNVGIGTTGPSGRLDVETASDTYINFSTSNNGSAAGICLLGNNNNEFFGYANSLRFATITGKNAAGFNERMRMDSSGRLLVGTSTARTIFENGTASARVQVEGTDNATSRLTVIRNGGGGGITLAGTAGASVGSIDAVANNATVGEIAFAGSDGTDFVNAANISVHVDGTPGADDMPGRLVFSTTADGASSPTERMRISQKGKINTYGTGTTDSIFNIENTTNTSGAYVFLTALGSNCNNTSSYHYIATTGAADKYYIYGNGTTGTPSDINLKKNIETTRNGYLEDLCQLRVVKYNWNEQEDGEPKELGIIAQELEVVFPGLIQQGPVKEDGSSYKSVKTSVLPFMLLKALQEVVAKIETLEARLTALESA